MRWTISAAAVAAATVLTAAGCAGAGGAPGSGGLGAGASVAPATTVAFVALDTDVSSGQWQAVGQLLQKLPAHDQLLSQLQQSFEQKTGLSWNDDVKPALGSELDVAMLPAVSAGEKPRLVVLTQPADTAKFGALLQKLRSKAGNDLVSRQVGGWTVASESTTALDAVQNATATLAADNTYQDAIGKLAGDSLVRAYANGAEAQQLLGSLPGQTQVTSTNRHLRLGHANGSAIAPEAFQWGAADVVAVDGGLKVEAFARSAAPVVTILQRSSYAQTPIQPYTAHLVDEIPAGPLFVADFQVVPGEFGLADPTKLPKPIRQLLEAVPQLSGQLDSIVGGETAIYVRPSLPVPEVTLVTQPADTQAAVTALDSVVSALKAAAAGAAGPLGALGNVQVYHALLGGELVVSTSQQGIADFRAAGQKLSADPAFIEAMQTAKVPQQTTGFVYVNLKAVLPIVQGIAALAGVTLPPAVQGSGLTALQTLTAFADRTRDLSSFTVFLAIK